MSESKTIVKTYLISNWTEYTEIEIHVFESLELVAEIACEKEVVQSVSRNLPCKITTYFDNDGKGCEKREYTITDPRMF